MKTSIFPSIGVNHNRCYYCGYSVNTEWKTGQYYNWFSLYW